MMHIFPVNPLFLYSGIYATHESKDKYLKMATYESKDKHLEMEKRTRHTAHLFCVVLVLLIRKIPK